MIMNDKVLQNINHPWQFLSTVTIFDRGSTARTAALMENNRESQASGRAIGHIQTSSSLLIESLIRQLCGMLEGDPKYRNKLYYVICDKLHALKLINDTYDIAEYNPIKEQYQRMVYHLFAIARTSINAENALQMPNLLTIEYPRYSIEFQEIEFISQGGFGTVYKALNRLDGIVYAIKKITSKRKESIERHLQEVRIFAKMTHVNIVSYKSTWIEKILPSTIIPTMSATNGQVQDAGSVSEKTSTSESDDSHPIGIEQNLSNETEEEVSKLNNTESSFEEDAGNSETNFDIVFRNDSTNSQNCTNSSVTHDITNKNILSSEDSSSERKICHYDSNMNQQPCYILYIQMGLCDSTLKQWLEGRNEPTPEHIIDTIINQILRGVDHMHSNNIVHHDIKPSNIFISTSGKLQIQLGDFGLACPRERERSHDACGTRFYAAPEQLAGKCDTKSDIYSVGIVLLELMIPMQTAMEEASVINNVKHGRVPDAVVSNYPKWADIVKQMVQIEPDKRPSTSELLRYLCEDEDARIAQIMHKHKIELSEKDSRIQELEKKLSFFEEYGAKSLGDP